MKYLFLIPFILLLLPSCKKKRIIEVHAINPVTGQPYAGQTFSIRSCRSGAYENKCKTVYEGVTNENGVALIETRLNTNRRHTLFMGAPEDYCYRSIPSYSINEELEKQEVTFEFAPCAQIKFRYYNQSCLNSNDRIEVTRYTDIEGYVGFQNPAVYEGCADYTSNYASVPMGWWYFEWKVIKNGQITNFTDSVYLEAGQQFQYDFIY